MRPRSVAACGSAWRTVTIDDRDRATSAAATGEVWPRPNGSSRRPRSRTVGPARGTKLSRNIVGRMGTTGRPDHASTCSPSQCCRCCHGHARLQVPGGHGQAEVDPPTAADDPRDVGRFEEVADHYRHVVVPVMPARERQPLVRHPSQEDRQRLGEEGACVGDIDPKVAQLKGRDATADTQF